MGMLLPRRRNGAHHYLRNDGHHFLSFLQLELSSPHASSIDKRAWISGLNRPLLLIICTVTTKWKTPAAPLLKGKLWIKLALKYLKICMIQQP
jgi:hypothetical protein